MTDHRMAVDVVTIREQARRQLEERLSAARAGVEACEPLVGSMGDEEPATRRLLEDILSAERRHVRELSDLLQRLDPIREGAAPVDASVEDAYWREHFVTRPYVREGELYESFRPAFRRGWEARGRYGELNWEFAEAALRRDWEREERGSKLSWEVARQAARDAWDRLDPTADYSSDNR